MATEVIINQIDNYDGKFVVVKYSVAKRRLYVLKTKKKYELKLEIPFKVVTSPYDSFNVSKCTHINKPTVSMLSRGVYVWNDADDGHDHFIFGGYMEDMPEHYSLQAIDESGSQEEKILLDFLSKLMGIKK